VEEPRLTRGDDLERDWPRVLGQSLRGDETRGAVRRGIGAEDGRFLGHVSRALTTGGAMDGGAPCVSASLQVTSIDLVENTTGTGRPDAQSALVS